jgi:hypothetical protein
MYAGTLTRIQAPAFSFELLHTFESPVEEGADEACPDT